MIKAIQMYSPKTIIRALRMPFIAASVLPFIFGSLIKKEGFNLPAFFLGLFAVVSTHLSANLINDYADAKSGVDSLDKRFFGFFGGSKLIQENILPEVFYLKGALIFAVLSLVSVCLLGILLKTILSLAAYLLIIFFSWSYSKKPLQFSYNMTGEVFIFLLFGPALVMGGYFIQTGIFPDLRSFVLSLPFGLFTTAILFANEVPDFKEDKQAGKLNWVNIIGPKRAFILYYVLMALAFSSVLVAIAMGFLTPLAGLCLVFLLPALKAAGILKEHYSEKESLVRSSQLTIGVQALVCVALILAILL